MREDQRGREQVIKRGLVPNVDDTERKVHNISPEETHTVQAENTQTHTSDGLE